MEATTRQAGEAAQATQTQKATLSTPAILESGSLKKTAGTFLQKINPVTIAKKVAKKLAETRFSSLVTNPLGIGKEKARTIPTKRDLQGFISSIQKSNPTLDITRPMLDDKDYLSGFQKWSKENTALIACIKVIDISSNRLLALQQLNGSKNWSHLDLRNFKQLQEITLTGNAIIECINFSGLSSLKELTLTTFAKLREVNITGNRSLETFSITDSRSFDTLLTDSHPKLQKASLSLLRDVLIRLSKTPCPKSPLAELVINVANTALLLQNQEMHRARDDGLIYGAQDFAILNILPPR